MRELIAFSSACVACAAVAAPLVSGVTMTQAGDTVTIGYTLSGEPAVVTLDLQTKTADGEWASIGGEHMTFVAGDANRQVDVGTHTITWKPRKAWPENVSAKDMKAVVSAWALDATPDYMVVSLLVPNEIRYFTCAEAIPNGVSDDLYKTELMVLRKIHASNVCWRMGSPPTEKYRSAAEEPHLVTLTKDYYIGVYEVTQRQYELVLRYNDSNAPNLRPASFSLESDYATRPVDKVSYTMVRGTAAAGYDWPANGHDVLPSGFIGKLRALSGVSGFDLPTDAQWEFACRAGNGSTYYNGTDDELDSIGRYSSNGGQFNGADAATVTADRGTAKVGSYAPNAWGLYDMLGNVWEWCLDWHQTSPLGFDPEAGPAEGTERIRRGGCWANGANSCRCATRESTDPTASWPQFGFRMAYTLD